MITQEMYDVHFQSSRILHIRISLLNKNLVKLGEIQGICEDGNIKLNGKSAARRMFDVAMHVIDNSFLIGYNKKIWMDKRFRVEIGIENLATGNVVWFDKGIYCLDDSSLNYNATNKTLSLNGNDLMCLYDGTLGGELENDIIIDAGAPLSDALRATAKDIAGITRLDIEANGMTVPYEIVKTSGDTVYSLFDELMKLYMYYELFFSTDGTLTYRRMKNRLYDPVILSFTQENRNLILDYNIKPNFSNVRNKIIVNGMVKTDGTQIQKTLINDNPNSPFNVNTDIGVIPLVINDDKVQTQESADSRAEYEFWLHNNLCDSVSITCLPFYFADVNKLAEFNVPEIELEGKYLIDDISIPLGLGDMTFTAYKIY